MTGGAGRIGLRTFTKWDYNCEIGHGESISQQAGSDDNGR
jgi:hypothetical protein